MYVRERSRPEACERELFLGRPANAPPNSGTESRTIKGPSQAIYQVRAHSSARDFEPRAVPREGSRILNPSSRYTACATLKDGRSTEVGAHTKRRSLGAQVGVKFW